jgi:hypothetical protein
MTKAKFVCVIVFVLGVVLAACQAQPNETASPTFAPLSTATEQIKAMPTKTVRPTNIALPIDIPEPTAMRFSIHQPSKWQ